MERERKKGADSDTRALTPSQLAKRDSEEKLDSMLPVPELRALNQQPINLKMNNQPAKVLFETVGKLAGINVLFDPEFKSSGSDKQTIDLTGATLDEALNYLGIVTKAFWKPLSPNTIFVTQDNTTKRRDYEEQVMKVFYLTNVTTPQELQEIVTAVRSWPIFSACSFTMRKTPSSRAVKRIALRWRKKSSTISISPSRRSWWMCWFCRPPAI